MTLVVEDGTGKPDAESYLTVAEADAYHVALGHVDWAGASDADKEVALRNGTRYIDANYRASWSGWPTKDREQRLAWPQKNAYAGIYPLKIDEIPRELKEATAEAALRVLLVPDALSPDLDASTLISSLSAGSVSIDFSSAGQDLASSGGGTYPAIDRAIAPLLGPTSISIGWLRRG